MSEDDRSISFRLSPEMAKLVRERRADKSRHLYAKAVVEKSLSGQSTTELASELSAMRDAVASEVSDLRDAIEHLRSVVRDLHKTINSGLKDLRSDIATATNGILVSAGAPKVEAEDFVRRNLFRRSSDGGLD